MTSQNLICERIKEVRRRRGLSQAQLAHPELSDSYISLIESGHRTPTPAVLELLAAKLGCSVSYLLNGVTAERMEDLELALRYASMALENGEIEEARQQYAELLGDENLVVLPELHHEAEFGFALANEACGNLAAAIPVLVGLREAASDDTPTKRRIDITLALIRCFGADGQLGLAVEIGEQTMADMIGQGWTEDLVQLGAMLLHVYYERGDLLRAQHFAMELLSAAEALGSPRAIVAAHWNAATTAHLAGRGDDAVPLAERALAIQSETGGPRNLGRLRTQYAFLRLRNRPAESAACRDLLLHAEQELRESAASTVDLARCLQFLAHAEINLDHIEQAIEYGHRCLDLLDENSPDMRADTLVLLGQANLLLGRENDAAADVKAAIALLEEEPISRMTAESWLMAAAVLEGLGDQEGSAIAYGHAMTCGGL